MITMFHSKNVLSDLIYANLLQFDKGQTMIVVLINPCVVEKFK